MNKYTVLRDQQEKANVWSFSPTELCRGTEETHLKTGDYTLAGYEDIFTIERKASTGEFATNINEARFSRELVRLDGLKHSFLIFEFTLDDVYSFPFNSGIPAKIWPKLRVTSNYMLKRIIEIETNHNVKVIFAGDRGPEIALVIFKRMVELYGKTNGVIK